MSVGGLVLADRCNYDHIGAHLYRHFGRLLAARLSKGRFVESVARPLERPQQHRLLQFKRRSTHRLSLLFVVVRCGLSRSVPENTGAAARLRLKRRKKRVYLCSTESVVCFDETRVIRLAAARSHRPFLIGIGVFGACSIVLSFTQR